LQFLPNQSNDSTTPWQGLPPPKKQQCEVSLH